MKSTLRTAKPWLIALLGIVLFLVIGIVLIEIFLPFPPRAASGQECTDPENCDALHWVMSESKYIGSEVDGESVQLKYSLVFENHDNVDCECSQLSAKFSFWESLGWMEYETAISGTCEDGSTVFFVPGGEKVSFNFVFSVKYTGGTIPEDLSLPVEIMFLQK